MLIWLIDTTLFNLNLIGIVVGIECISDTGWIPLRK